MVEVYVVRAFSKGGKGGNKAGVVLDSHDLMPAKMMAIAKDLGYSETAFLTESDVADFKVRYFTPTEEVPLCGHATIATFSILNSLGKPVISKRSLGKAGPPIYKYGESVPQAGCCRRIWIPEM